MGSRAQTERCTVSDKTIGSYSESSNCISFQRNGCSDCWVQPLFKEKRVRKLRFFIPKHFAKGTKSNREWLDSLQDVVSKETSHYATDVFTEKLLHLKAIPSVSVRLRVTAVLALRKDKSEQKKETVHQFHALLASPKLKKVVQMWEGVPNELSIEIALIRCWYFIEDGKV
jgi:hypothetical protein